MTLKNILILSLLTVPCLLNATAPLNIFKPYDILLEPARRYTSGFNLDFAYEGSLSSHGFMEDEEFCVRRNNCNPGIPPQRRHFRDFVVKVRPLQLWQREQNILGTLSALDTPFFQDTLTLLNECAGENFSEENALGRYCLFGDLHIHNFMFGARIHLPRNISLGVYLPVISMKLDKVAFAPKDESTSSCLSEEGITADALLEDVLKAINYRWQGWQRTGLGDLACLVSWANDYPQQKPLLRNVRPRMRLGLTFPTGKNSDEDLLFAIPFGGDGSVGILFGGTLELWFAWYIRCGIDAEFWHVFPSTRDRRIKTDLAETDFLFPVKVPTYKQIGFNQKFTLFVEHGCILPGWSARIAYQFIKQNEDTLFIGSDRFSPLIVNEAESVQEWTAHNLILSTRYEWPYENACYKPYVTLFYKWGFNGKRVVAVNSLGFSLGMHF